MIIGLPFASLRLPAVVAKSRTEKTVSIAMRGQLDRQELRETYWEKFHGTFPILYGFRWTGLLPHHDTTTLEAVSCGAGVTEAVWPGRNTPRVSFASVCRVHPVITWLSSIVIVQFSREEGENGGKGSRRVWTLAPADGAFRTRGTRRLIRAGCKGPPDYRATPTALPCLSRTLPSPNRFCPSQGRRRKRDE